MKGWMMAAVAGSVLSGCSALDSPGGRVTLLVLLPALVIGVLLWRLARPRPGRDPRDPRRPDYDDEDGPSR